MDPIEQFPYEGTTAILIAKDQAEYRPLPALVFEDGRVLTEWQPSEDERLAIAQGENLRLWIWVFPHRCACCGLVEAGKLQPVALDVMDEHKG